VAAQISLGDGKRVVNLGVVTVSHPSERTVTESILAECKARGGRDVARIVIDEQRSNRPKAARPFGVAFGSPLDVVA
jgi:hypothetical protein